MSKGILSNNSLKAETILTLLLILIPIFGVISLAGFFGSLPLQEAVVGTASWSFEQREDGVQTFNIGDSMVNFDKPKYVCPDEGHFDFIGSSDCITRSFSYEGKVYKIKIGETVKVGDWLNVKLSDGRVMGDKLESGNVILRTIADTYSISFQSKDFLKLSVVNPSIVTEVNSSDNYDIIYSNKLAKFDGGLLLKEKKQFFYSENSYVKQVVFTRGNGKINILKNTKFLGLQEVTITPYIMVNGEKVFYDTDLKVSNYVVPAVLDRECYFDTDCGDGGTCTKTVELFFCSKGSTEKSLVTIPSGIPTTATTENSGVVVINKVGEFFVGTTNKVLILVSILLSLSVIGGLLWFIKR